MEKYTFHINILQCHQSLKEAIDALCLYVCDHLTDLPIWIADHHTFTQSRYKLCQALTCFAPQQALPHNATPTFPGAAGCDLDTLTLIDTVNAAKDALKEAVMAYKQADCYDQQLPANKIIAKAGHGFVRLKQLYRHIHYLSWHPRRIAWSKARDGSNVRISLAEAQKRLLRFKGENIDIQLKALGKINDKVLVAYRPIRPYSLVNVAPFKDEPHDLSSIRTSLPVFYLHDHTKPLPDVVFSNKANRDPTQHRSDRRIGKLVLPAIHTYVKSSK